MRSTKKPNARQLTSTLMAIVMTATTTFQMPNIALASEAESSVAVESQIEEVTTEEASSAEVQSETAAQAAAEAETQTSTALETSGTEAGTDATQASQASDEVPATVAETTAEVTYEEEKTTLSAEVDPSGEDTEESDANETRGPDEELTTEIETEAQTDAASEEETEASTEEALIDLSTATKEEILSYIEAIGGDESDAFYAFIGSLGEDDYQLVWMAQYGAEEDQLLEKFGFDYDNASDLEIAKYVHKLSEEELADFVESMTFEQYRRYISIKEMMAEMDEKDFADVVDEEEFTADHTWDYASYDAANDLEKFSSSLGDVLGYIKYSKDKKALSRFLNDSKAMIMDNDAARVIRDITNTPIYVPDGKGEIDMCKAVKDMLDESKTKGLEEGKAEGFSQLSKLIELLSDEERYADIKKIAKDAAYRDMLMKEYHLI